MHGMLRGTREIGEGARSTIGEADVRYRVPFRVD